MESPYEPGGRHAGTAAGPRRPGIVLASLIAVVGIGYAFIGIGVGFAGTPASHSLTGSVPVYRAGMASGTADLQRDLGGAIMQAVFGALLTAGYASSFSSAIAGLPASDQQQITDNVESELTKSFAGAEYAAQQYPEYASRITETAKASFLAGDRWAYLAGIIAILLGPCWSSSCTRRRLGRRNYWRVTDLRMGEDNVRNQQGG